VKLVVIWYAGHLCMKVTPTGAFPEHWVRSG
jgi:hypothetical protein